MTSYQVINNVKKHTHKNIMPVIDRGMFHNYIHEKFFCIDCGIKVPFVNCIYCENTSVQYMWPDLTKASFHTHNGKADFLPLLDFYINELTIHVCIITNGFLVCFSWGLFLGPVWCARVLGWSSNGSGVTGRHPPRWKSPHDWVESLTINWLLFVISRAQMGLRWDLLAVSTSTHGKTCHFRGSPPPLTSTLYDHLW